jgi:DNA-binding response OmpR family regulator
MATILIIEDDGTLRTTLDERLTLEGFRVASASNGEDGLRLALERPPDLILCDIMMPGLDGYGVLRGLQKDPRTAAIPFVFLTAKATPMQVRVGMGIGADDYLCKPVTNAELLVAIRARLWKRDRQVERSEHAAAVARQGVVRKLPQEIIPPLTNLLSAAQLMEVTTTAKSPQEIQELGRCLRTATERLQRTARRFLLAELEVASRDPAAQAQLRGTCYIPAAAWVTAQVEHLARQHSRREDLRLDLAQVDLLMATNHFSELVAQLVSNAFKFSPTGSGVLVQLALLPNDWCELVVRDRGRGLTAEQARQAEDLSQTGRDLWSQPGAGLGLALVGQLVALYGGKFTIKGELDSGTRATVRLPRGRPGSKSASPLEPGLLQKVAWALGKEPPEAL